MKIALGIIARPVESLLVLCLRPVVAQFDGLVMLTSRNPDWIDDVAGLVHAPRKFDLFNDYEWKNDYGAARNVLIANAEKLGYDWLFMLDADESMLPDDLIVMRKYMETEESLIFPRFEFVDDFHHFCPSFYPDYQARAFRLNIGYHYTGALHEQLRRDQDPPAYQMPYSTRLPMCPIFHYAKSKPTMEVWLKYNTYDRIAAGLQPFSEVPPGTVPPPSWALENKRVPFLGRKPL